MSWHFLNCGQTIGQQWKQTRSFTGHPSPSPPHSSENLQTFCFTRRKRKYRQPSVTVTITDFTTKVSVFFNFGNGNCRVAPTLFEKSSVCVHVCVRACVVERGEEDWSSTLGASQIFFPPAPLSPVLRPHTTLSRFSNCLALDLGERNHWSMRMAHRPITDWFFLSYSTSTKGRGLAVLHCDFFNTETHTNTRT